MKSQLPEKYWKDLIPDYRESLLAVIPSYLFNEADHHLDIALHCKRVAYDAGWLASFARDNVELVSSPIVGVSEKGLFTADGREHELDVIVWATGFEVSSTGVGLNENVFGENGRELREVWEENGGAYGYQGILGPGVPNYFVVLGPNAAAMSWGFALAHNVSPPFFFSLVCRLELILTFCDPLDRSYRTVHQRDVRSSTLVDCRHRFSSSNIQ